MVRKVLGFYLGSFSRPRTEPGFEAISIRLSLIPRLFSRYYVGEKETTACACINNFSLILVGVSNALQVNSRGAGNETSSRLQIEDLIDCRI